jgi:hypothetical protein
LCPAFGIALIRSRSRQYRRSVLALSTARRHPAIALAVAQINFPNEPYLGAPYVARQHHSLVPRPT